MFTLKDLETAPQGANFSLQQTLDQLKWDEQGLIAAIAQQHDTHQVLMMAWMNRQALEETLTTGRVCYFSRSRQRLWRKGEESGQVQKLVSLAIDCDGDALLLQVDQTGPACHTGRKSCFYSQVEGDHITIATAPLIDPQTLYHPSKTSK